MNDMAIPEEFIIIGAALTQKGRGVSMKRTVTNDDINAYKRRVYFPVIYDDSQEFEYCKFENGVWNIIKQPPLPPQLVHILLNGV